jgi:hypothetical protein
MELEQARAFAAAPSEQLQDVSLLELADVHAGLRRWGQQVPASLATSMLARLQAMADATLLVQQQRQRQQQGAVLGELAFAKGEQVVGGQLALQAAGPLLPVQPALQAGAAACTLHTSAGS